MTNGSWRNPRAPRALARPRQGNGPSLMPLIPIILGTLFMLGTVIRPI